MVQRNPVVWVGENRLAAAGVALIVVAAAIVVALNTGGHKTVDRSIARTGRGPAASEGPAASQPPGAATGGLAHGAGAVAGSGRPASQAETPGLIPGLSPGSHAKPCTPARVSSPGVTPTSITIGQVVTDSSQLPQQLKPVNEGLEAFVKAFNASGGLCKRTLKLEYRNDNLNPATHTQDMQQLAGKVLAFVGNDSLLDFLDYGRNPPFDPNVQGGGGFVPDVGGLAFGYGRSQSKWHAGVIGSVSPVLVGGGQFKALTAEARAAGKPCRQAGVVYLNEPTGASQDQATLGSVAVEKSWGGGLGAGKTKMYAAELTDQDINYQALVERMVADGMNCVFSYTDLQGSIRLVKAMHTGGYWPPKTCTRGPSCFRVAWVPFTVYDAKFIKDAGPAALSVSTFIPHLPLAETSNSIRVYLDALKAVTGARPSTFSIFGFASGVMFVQALSACPEAPTRSCLMKALHSMRNFTGGGLLGGTTPFRTTRVTYASYGSFDWKWIFNRSVALRVLDRGGKRDFYRISPGTAFLDDILHVARGSPS